MELAHFIDFRKMLHRYPDLSGDESRTRELVRAFVAPFAPGGLHTVGKGCEGLLLTYQGQRPGKTMLVRAELDALPIAEVNTFGHRSVYPGKGHKCGHDGHMAILARLAWKLHQEPPAKGTAYLLFQPAEENGKGAQAVLQDPEFKQLVSPQGPDQVLALHNIPGFKLGEVLLRDGIFTPAVRSIIVQYKGKTSHAAEPEKGLSSAPALARLMQAALAMSSADPGNPEFFLVSPVYMHMGEKSYGVTAGDGELHLTIRAWDNKLLDQKATELETLASAIGKDLGLSTQTSWTECFDANENDADVVDQVRQAATALGQPVRQLSGPMKWGEDFGLFTRQFKGAMFGVGSGERHPALHNPDYDFPDPLIEPASDLMECIVRNYLSS